MKYNEKEMIEYSFKPATREGRLVYKSPKKSSVYSSVQKEKWFKLIGNLLFYYRLNQNGCIENEEPNGMFIMENISVEPEIDGVYKLSHGFSIKWKEEPFKKHIFFATSLKSQSLWITSLLKASYSNLQAELLSLRIQIRNITGKDPLEHMGNSVKKLPHMKDRHLKHSESVSNSEWYINTADTNVNNTHISSAPNTPMNIPKVPPRNKSNRNSNGNDENKINCKKEKSFLSHINNETTTIGQETINSTKIKPPTNLLD